jgi:tetratricopeptide (TPR) repeat protein
MFAAPVLALALAAVLAAPVRPTLRQLIESRPPDSLVPALTRFEATHRGREAQEAAFALGQLRYARGEYRQAALAFGRATPRLPGPERAEPRYWAGLAWLGAGDAVQARAAFEEAARSGSQHRAEALLGVARCWEVASRPDRALEALTTLLAGDPGEAGPAALEATAALADRMGRSELARRSRERLLSTYPRSVEAVRARPDRSAPPAPAPSRPSSPPARPAPVAPPAGAVHGPLTVQIGAFGEPAAAQALATRARGVGAGPVRVSELRGAGGARLYAVRAGVYATAEDARAAGERLGRALGVPWRVVAAP